MEEQIFLYDDSSWLDTQNLQNGIIIYYSEQKYFSRNFFMGIDLEKDSWPIRSCQNNQIDHP